MSETYRCASCGTGVDREYEVRSIIRTCDECQTNCRFLHTSLVDSLREIPDEDRPDEWDSMSLAERFEDAVKRGLIEITRG